MPIHVHVHVQSRRIAMSRRFWIGKHATARVQSITIVSLLRYRIQKLANARVQMVTILISTVHIIKCWIQPHVNVNVKRERLNHAVKYKCLIATLANANVARSLTVGHLKLPIPSLASVSVQKR